MLFALGFGMKIFQNVLVLVLVLLVGALAYGQDCLNGQCPTSQRPVMRSIVEAPVTVIQSTGAVVRRAAAAPQRVFAQRPVRRLFSRLRRR